MAFTIGHADWNHQDIGSVGQVGDAVYDQGSGTYTVTGAGLGVAGSADALHYVYQTIDGDSEITVAISSLSSENPYTAAGLMIRESLNANSKQTFLSVSDQDGVNFLSRNSTGGGVVKTVGPSLEAPVWLRMQRVGTSILGFVSSNGVNWTLVGRTELEFASGQYYVGFGLSSAVSGALATGVFGQLMCLGNLPYGISGMRLWLRADAGVYSGTGGLVTDWEDQSGNGNHAQQSTLANQPVWIDDQVNGLPTLQFNGTSNFLSIADAASLKPSQLTIFVVGKHTGGSATGLYLAKTGSSTLNDGYSISRLTSGSSVGITISGTASATSVPLASGTYGILSGKYDLSKVRFSLDGGTPAATDFATSISHSNQPLYLGGLPASSRLQGNIAEVLLFGRALSSLEQKRIESYLGGKYGLSSGVSFGVPGGTYSENQSVSLIAPQGAAIYYTVDGSTPTTSSSLYTGPISISTTTVLKAIYVQNGGPASAVASAVYTIDPAAYSVSRDGLALWLRADVGVSGTGAVTKWLDQSGSGNDAIPPTAPNQPTFQAGVLGGKPVLRFNGSNSYLTLGSGLNRSSALPMTLVIVTKNSTNPNGLFDSAPGLSNGFIFSDQKVEFDSSSPFKNFTLSSTGAIATIIGQIGGGGVRLMAAYGDESGTRVDQNSYNTTGSGTRTISNPFGSNASVTLGGVADDSLSVSGTGITGFVNSSIQMGGYQSVNISFTLLAANSFAMWAPNPSGGYNGYTIGVTMVDTNYVPGQLMIGNTSPVVFSNPQIGRRGTGTYYTGDIAEVLFYQRALSSADKMGIDSYLVQKYGVGILPSVASPTFSLPSATYASAQTVSISVPSGSTVYYTTDGSDPTTSSSVYAGSIPITTTTTVKAIAVKTGFQTSNVARAAITIDSATANITRNGMRLWLRADSSSGTSGSPISSWADQSGNMVNAISSGTSSYPSFQTNILNGKPVMRFDGINDYFKATPATSWSGTQNSVFILMKPNSAVNYNQSFAAGASEQFAFSTASGGGIFAGTGTTRFDPGSGAGQIPNGTLVLNAWQLFEYVCDNGMAKFYKNGNLISSKTMQAPLDWTSFSIGSGTSETINGDVAEVFVYNSALTDTERKDLEAYLNTRYNLGLGFSLAAPVLSGSTPPNGTIYASGSTHSIAVEVPSGVEIRYTTDGTDPTSGSTLYTAPISITATTTLKFKAFRTNYSPSQTTSVTYTFDSQAVFTRSGLVLWTRADQGVTLSGSNVTQWSDLSGNGNHATQGDSSRRPVIQNSQVNGKPVVRFDGSNDVLSVADAASLKPSQVTAFVVGKHTGGDSDGVYLVKGDYWSQSNGYAITRTTSGSNGGFYANSSSSMASVPLGTNTYAIMSGRYNGQQVSFNVSGGAPIVTTYSTTMSHSTQPLFLGAGDGSRRIAGDIAEVLVFNRALTDMETAEVQSYLYQRYNVGSAPMAPTPTLSGTSPPSGSVITAQDISLNVLPGVDVRYTTDGSEPTVGSTLYSGPVNVNASMTLKFKAFKTGYTPSQTATVVYTVDSQTAFTRSGLVLWTRADQGVTLSGSNVTQWSDLSGNGNHATQGDSSRRPVIQNSQVNGKPVVRFDGSNDVLSVADAASLKPSQVTAFVVGKHTGGDSDGVYLVKGDYWSQSNGYAITRTTSGSNGGFYANSSSSMASVPLGTNTYAIMSGRYNGQQVSFNVSGGAPIVTTYSTTMSHSTQPLYLGAGDWSQKIAGDIAEVLVFNRALTDMERAEVQSYLYQRYNVGSAPMAPTPTLSGTSPPSGSVITVQDISLNVLPGVDVRYTTDGSEPTVGSTLYSGPINVNASMTLKFKAFKTGYTPSQTATVVYTVDSQANFTRSNLMMWLRADQGVTMSGTSVSQWNDLSGAGRHVLQTSSSNRPLFQTGVVNGKPVIRFDGSNDNLSVTFPNSIAFSQHSVIFVMKPAGVSNYNQRVGALGGWGQFLFHTTSAGGVYVGTSDSSGSRMVPGTGAGEIPDGTVAVNAWQIFEYTFNGSTASFFKNGLLKATRAIPPPSNWTGFRLGGDWDTINGDVAEVLVYNSALTVTDRQELEAYLNARYNLGTPPQLAAPSLTPATVFTGSQSVTASSQVIGATIRYTTDGSDPTASSTVYTGPLSLSATTLVKVRAFKAGHADSPVTAVNYAQDATAIFSQSGLKLWLRADQGLTVTGSAVSQWGDLSGNANVAMQATGTSQPLVISGVNGKSVLLFDGTNDYLSIADSASLKPANMTAYIVAGHSGGGNSAILLAKSGSTSWTNGYGLVREGSANSFGYFINNNATVKATGTILAGYYFMAQAAYDNVRATLLVNGQPLAPATYSTAISHATQPLLLGGDGTATYSFGGAIAEILLFDRKLTLAEQAEVEKYLETRYAISSDADGDGLPRWKELELGSDPAKADTNDNGVSDGAEYNSGFSPTSTDSDGDGLSNAQEYALGTNAFWADSDGDGVNDGSDAYPLDPTASSNTDPTPSVAPTITLELPTNAVLLP